MVLEDERSLAASEAPGNPVEGDVGRRSRIRSRRQEHGRALALEIAREHALDPDSSEQRPVTVVVRLFVVRRVDEGGARPGHALDRQLNVADVEAERLREPNADLEILLQALDVAG